VAKGRETMKIHRALSRNLAVLTLSAAAAGSAFAADPPKAEERPVEMVPGWEANPQKNEIPAIEFRYSQLVDVLGTVLEESGVNGFLCIPPREWPWVLLDSYSTGAKDLKTILEELSDQYSFAWEWGPEFLLVAPDVGTLAWFGSRLEDVAPKPVQRGQFHIGAATDEYGPGMNARVFRVTDDTGMDPESVFRRLEVIRGVVEILGIMLYENGTHDPENLQRRIFYPETREDELRDMRFLGTITVIDTEENLRKVRAYLDSARRSVLEFKVDYDKWSRGKGEDPQEMRSPGIFREPAPPQQPSGTR
jgi:hypothetical protein